MDGFFKYVGGWLLAVLSTATLGIIIQTQNVISRLGNIGADVGFSERLTMTLYDLRYLGLPYVIFIAIAFMVAFAVSELTYHFTKFGRTVIYTVAGAVAILVMLFSMKQVFFDIHIIAGARDGLGIGLQMLTGAIGGFVFSNLSKPNKKGSQTEV